MLSSVSVQRDNFDPGVEQASLTKSTATGAVVAFTGRVRDEHLDETVRGLYLEHYPGMTKKALEAIMNEAAERWSLQALRVVHRIGQLKPGDNIVFVGVASAHRKAAFEACEFVMDYLKTRVPFWKKEQTTTGEQWIDAKVSDDQAAQRWLASTSGESTKI